jgi:ketosteroid isomerase-like protein
MGFGRPTRVSWSVAVVVTAAGFAASPAWAMHVPPLHALHERKHDAKRQVEALEEKWRAAQLAGDISAMDNLLSDDYIGISMTGQVHTKAQQLDRARAHKFTLTRLDLGDMQVKLVGSIAIVTSRAEVQGINDGTPVEGTYRYTRVYQRLPGGDWKITSFEATRVPAPHGVLKSSRDGEAGASELQHIAPK